MTQLLQIHVVRFDPARDQVPHTETFTVETDGPISVLQALRRIYRDTDPSLGFRNADCRRGVCGVCSLTIDGRRVLACMQLARDGMTIATPPNRPVLRDLVFEMDSR